jgi:hypothetical protein
MTPEEDPLESFDLDAEEPTAAARRAQDAIVIDLDEAVFAVLQRVDTRGDPSAWIGAAVREKAQREDPSHDVADRLHELLDEMVRIVKLEQEFAEPAAIVALRELIARLRDAEAVIETLGRMLDDKAADDADEEF